MNIMLIKEALSRRRSNSKGFTLFELLIAIAISSIIGVAIYFTFTTSLESWGYSKDRFSLQEVLQRCVKEIAEGSGLSFGIKDSLEMVEAHKDKIVFVPPWTDDTHVVTSSREFVYTLNQRLKPGAGPPIGEVRFPEAVDFHVIPLKLWEGENLLETRIQLTEAQPAGSALRFTYYPDVKTNPLLSVSIWWDKTSGKIFREDDKGKEEISRNPFGVKISKFKISYYDQANNLLNEDVDTRNLAIVSGVEVYLEGELEGHTFELLDFIYLRNAASRAGFLSLRKGMKFTIPDSSHIHFFCLDNFSGIGNRDELELEARPKTGKSWRIKITFGRGDYGKPWIDSYRIEYPPQHVIYTDFSKTAADLGVNLLSLGPNGLYDYDDDQDIEDIVLLKGEVTLEVTKMDIEGAGLFVR